MTPVPYTPDDTPDDRVQPISGFTPFIPWPDPTPEQLQTLWFNRIWDAIKTWDVNGEPAQPYHVAHILNSISPDNYFDENE